MTLLEAPALVRDMARYVDNGEFMIEANEIGAIQLAHEKSLPFVVGSPINCYNQHTLNLFLKQGMQRWVMPVELSREWLDRKSTRLNSSHVRISYAVFCLKKKNKKILLN